jgi:hypothetical protein
MLLFNKNLLKDTCEIDMPPLDKYEPTFSKTKTLQNQLISICNEWVKTAKKVIPVSISGVVPVADDLFISAPKDEATMESKPIEEKLLDSANSLNSIAPEELKLDT